nr:DUF4435 domain-containing protein [uncultured Lachnoanaerobaculum sp.]
MSIKSNDKENKEDLKYTSEAIVTESLYFGDVNDINIYVEDEGKEYIYETIFKRLMGDKYKIEKIFGVGGKEKLKKYFREIESKNQNYTKNKNIYVADGDFDRYICEHDMINSTNFIYLETYNIENYYIDKNASQNQVKRILKVLDAQVEEKLGFDNWKDKIVKQASKLFFYYCYVKKNHPEIQTVSRSPYLFINKEDGLEKKGAFDKYKKEVLSLNPNADTEVEKIKNRYHEIYNDDFNIICGKFLLDSLYCHIKSIVKKDFSKDEFIWNLVKEFDIDKLEYIKEKILCSINVT